MITFTFCFAFSGIVLYILSSFSCLSTNMLFLFTSNNWSKSWNSFHNLIILFFLRLGCLWICYILFLLVIYVYCWFIYILACDLDVLRSLSFMIILDTVISYKLSSLFLVPCRIAWSSLATHIFFLLSSTSQLITQLSKYNRGGGYSWENGCQLYLPWKFAWN